jgi:ATP-dependent Clp protease ATP-binding subunit ClpB
LLDDGRLTDSQGRMVDFKNTIVILTSNLGSRKILDSVGLYTGERGDEIKNAVMEDVRNHFRPEFLNRIDEVIVFHALTESQLKEIVTIQLRRLRERLEERKVKLELTDEAKTHLVRAGYDPAYGARPLKRVIQKEVETELAKRILRGEIRDGQMVVVDYDRVQEELTFASRSPGAPAAATG